MLEFQKYVKLLKYYIEKYGEKTMVFSQLGSFYEMSATSYECEVYPYIEKVAHILNFAIKQRENKSILVGFPDYACDKHLKTLLENNYTVIIQEQFKDANGNVTSREVTAIHSPGTFMDVGKDGNSLLSIYVDIYFYKKQKIFDIAISKIDITTSQNYLYEIEAKPDDIYFSLDELYKFIKSSNPKEILLNINSNSDEINTDLEKLDLIKFLEVNPELFKLYEPDDDYRNINYQKQFLNNFFVNETQLEILEYLSLNNFQPKSRNSYILLLHYINSNNKNYLNYITEPQFHSDNYNLILTKNTVSRLNIIDNNNLQSYSNITSVFDIINHTCTSMGHRELKHRLLNPIFDKNILNKRYKSIKILNDNPDLSVRFTKDLKTLVDLERINRKLSIQNLNKYNDLLSMMISYNKISEILDFVKEEKLDKHFNFDEALLETFNEFLEDINKIFDKDNVSTNKVNIFKKGYNQEIDDAFFQLNKNRKFIDMFCNEISFQIIMNEESKRKNPNTDITRENVKSILSLDTSTDARRITGFKWKISDPKIGSFGKISKSKVFELKSEEFGIKEKFKIDNIRLSRNTGKDKSALVHNQKVETYFNEHSKYYFKTLDLVDKFYLETVKKLSSKYHKVLVYISNIITDIDIACSSYLNLSKNNYCIPEIFDNQEDSYFMANQVRHPIIEKISKNEIYVPNYVKLGFDKGNNGILLYGINASGKSSLMKSLGLAVIMAQAGLPVACKSFEYKPYHNVFVRIGSDDNLFMSESSFTNEIHEIRDIMKRTDNHTLVIGDEICSGTEFTSATSIVASTINYLANKNASFIFASHLHYLTEIPMIKKLKNLSVNHLSVTFDEVNKLCIYDRKLKYGQGQQEYGLEVIKSLNMTEEFLASCYKVRNFIKPNDNFDLNKSKYNAAKFLGLCQLCKINRATDTHHINHQEYADENGNINHFHKNHLGNLTALCKDCHDKHHNGTITIEGYQSTSKGSILSVKNNDNKDVDNLINKLNKLNDKIDNNQLYHTESEEKNNDSDTTLVDESEDDKNNDSDTTLVDESEDDKNNDSDTTLVDESEESDENSNLVKSVDSIDIVINVNIPDINIDVENEENIIIVENEVENEVERTNINKKTNKIDTYSKEEINFIIKHKESKLTKKNIISLFEDKYDKTISNYMITKICKENIKT